MTKNRDIEALAQPARDRVKLFLKARNVPGNIEVGVAETTRTREQQKEYVKAWLSKTMESNHLTGLAVDIFFNVIWDIYLEKRKDWDQIWRNLCQVANSFWLVNAFYDLNRWFDKPHFQIREAQKPIGKSTEWYANASKYKDQKPKPQRDPLVDRLVNEWYRNWIEWEWVTERIALLIAKTKYT